MPVSSILARSAGIAPQAYYHSTDSAIVESVLQVADTGDSRHRMRWGINSFPFWKCATECAIRWTTPFDALVPKARMVIREDCGRPIAPERFSSRARALRGCVECESNAEEHRANRKGTVFREEI